MFRSLQNIVPSHLADSKLFDFQGLAARAVEGGELPMALDGGDTAFDVDPEIENLMRREQSAAASVVTFADR